MNENRPIASDSNAPNASLRSVSIVVSDPLSFFHLNCCHNELLISFTGFECNLKIHIGVNHPNDGSGDATNNQIKNESEPIAQQIEVWIEERKYEIGTYKVIVTLQCFRNVQ